MEDHSNTINIGLKEGELVGGYLLERTVGLSEINSFYYMLKHQKTGAKHIHIANEDKENTFSVAFKTVPADSTGVAHILEHTALCGSKKFPVRDPFFSMIKRSLNTFMNAFTASDWTMYPYATQNRKDFYNLMDVYLDAAFFPNIDELSFMQEGHRIEFDEESTIVYKGVVYNEMKGAMSSENQVMARSLLNALYPETTYRFNSGGDPAVIPSLTHKQLKEFHKRHYHPSNAFFYTYGNIPLEDHLIFIENKILKNFDYVDPKTDVPSHKRWKKSAEVSYSYPVAEDEDLSKKCQVAMAWMTSDIQNSFEVLTLLLLEQILLGNSASPLRKALIDSELGTALSDGSGFDSDNRDTFFSCGLKGVSESSASEIKKIIFTVLEDLTQNGVDPQLVESAIHQIEFHRKEVTNSPYPYGIKLLLSFAGTWFNGGDPEMILLFDSDLDKIRRKLAQGAFFESQIRKYFIDNTHRVRLLLKPDTKMEQEEKDRVQDELKKLKEKLTPLEIETIHRNAQELKKLQEADEDLSNLPTLVIEDIPPDIDIVKKSDGYNDSPAECYGQPTSGIFYFSAAAGIGGLQKDLIPLVPFFCSAFSMVGTQDHEYTEIAKLIDMYTGGLGMVPQARTSYSTEGRCMPFISFGSKCLVRNLDRMFDIIEELLSRIDFYNFTRLKNLIMEYQTGMESMIVNNGHRLSISLASRNFTPATALGEIWGGVHQLKAIKKITRDFHDKGKTDSALQNLADNLTAIGKAIFRSSNLKSALVGEDNILPSAVERVQSVYDRIPEGGDDGFFQPHFDTESILPREGWSISSAVSFVAGIFKTVTMTHEDAPALSVISKLLKSMYLHREIREKGGAYGGFSVYNSEEGLFGYASYRDPHIFSTVNAFNGASDFIRSGDYGNEDIKESILQVCSEIDKPDTPGISARKAFFRKIVSLSDDARARFKMNLLKLDHSDILRVAEKYFSYHPDELAIAVISGEEKLKEANEKLGDRKLLLNRI